MNIEDYSPIIEQFPDDPVSNTVVSSEPFEPLLPLVDPVENANQNNLNLNQNQTSDFFFNAFNEKYNLEQLATVNDNNEEVIVDFRDIDDSDLKQEVLTNILNDEFNTRLDSLGIDKDTLLILESLKNNKTTLNEYIEEEIASGVKANGLETIFNNSDVNQYTDEELFLFDLSARYPTMTQDELIGELQKEETNSYTFKKKVDAIRQEYNEIEKNHYLAEEQEQAYLKEQKEIEFANKVVDAASNTNSIMGFDLDMEDKQEIIDLLFTRDSNGMTVLQKALNDPNVIFNLGFLLKNENSVSEYMNTKSFIDKFLPYSHYLNKPAQSKNPDGFNDSAPIVRSQRPSSSKMGEPIVKDNVRNNNNNGELKPASFFATNIADW